MYVCTRQSLAKQVVVSVLKPEDGKGDNLLTDDYREITSTEYGRAAYAYNIVQDDKEINYLYSIDDQRMFKEIITSTETKREYYLSDAMEEKASLLKTESRTGCSKARRKVVALRTEITPTGQPASAAWEYYAHGAEREARLVNTDNNPKFEADEVTFFVYDHLGNTRMSYTPQIALVPSIDEEIFNHNFGALLYDWEGLDANTDVYLGSGALYAENLTGAAVAVKPGVSFEAGHTYTLTIAATEVNVSSIVVAVNNITIGTIQNSGLTDTFTFVVPSTGLFDIRIIGNGSSGTREFYVKTIKLEDQTPAHVAYSYVINHAADYFPYGKVLREYVGTEKERYLTTQHERDEETGLDYRGARYYDADIGRFLSLDPLANQFPEWSAYNYVFSNPIVFVDPTGKSPEDPDDKVKPASNRKDLNTSKNRREQGGGSKSNDAPPKSSKETSKNSSIGMAALNSLPQIKQGSPSNYGKPSSNPFGKIYYELNAEKNNGSGIGGRIFGLGGYLMLGQETNNGVNFNSEDGLNITGKNGKDMGKRYGLGGGALVPYIGEIGGDFTYTKFKNGESSATIGMSFAFIGRFEYDFVKKELFTGLSGSAGFMVPWTGYDASAKFGRKIKF